MAEELRPKQRRGFACMDKDRVKAIAATGGKRAHELGKAYTWTHESATTAGAKGGRVKKADHPNAQVVTVDTHPLVAARRGS